MNTTDPARADRVRELFAARDELRQVLADDDRLEQRRRQLRTATETMLARVNARLAELSADVDAAGGAQ